MPAPQVILDLVARFVEHKETYKSSSYNETQVRRDFIDPFFRELGWDVDNSAGYAEAYRDVVHEDSVKVSGATKAPDYGFRIGGQRKFFLEAKKPSISIKNDVGPAYQLRRYAWSAKLPLSVLTDFEEFAVYDCNKKPLPSDAASKGRILYFTFDQYAEKWDEIAGVFSKEAVLKGSFDKFAVTAKGKRGTTAVDEEFLATIEEWRADLARNLAIRNTLLTQRELNFSVQRVIDRIIFLRICEDRGIEDYGRLRLATEEKGAIYPRLVQLFKQADERYNSGLFHFNEEKGRNEAPDSLTPELEVDDSTLKKIIRGLYYPESPYEFRVLSADILGSVYEQFLGKVIRLTESHQAKIEEKPEVKKAGGVYYTPTYIVDYIVKQTVGPLLEGKTPKQIEKVHILDPACGSGSFLIGAYQFLLDWYQRYYTENKPEILAKGKTPQIVASPGGGYELTIPERKRILTTHLYGVDLDSQAVEVTKLSLLLKVLEGETAQRLQRELIQERVLPDLDDNIKCGNSLIASDYYTQPGLPAMDTEDHLRINVFDWDGKDGFPEIMKSGGFDAVIGNPPYVRQESLKETKGYVQSRYEAYDGVADLYAYFMEKSVKMLRQGGLFSIIVSNGFLRTNFAAPLRRTLKKYAAVRRLVDFGGLPVFSTAKDTYVCIPLLERGGKQAAVEICKIPALDLPDMTQYVTEHRYLIPDDRLTEEAWSLQSDAEASLFSKIMQRGQPLGEYVGGKIFYGIKTGLNEAFVIDSKTRDELIHRDPKSAELIKPLRGGENIRRYEVRASQDWIIFARRGVAIDSYPAIKEHLSVWKSELAPRNHPEMTKGRKPGRYEWYEIQDDVAYYSVFDGPKIIFPDICKGPRFYLDDSGSYIANTAYCLGTEDRYLLGFLNSRLFWFAIANISIPFGVRAGQFRYRLIYQYMEKVPVRVIDPANKVDKAARDQIVSLVDQMMSLHKLRSGIKTPHEQTATDRQISAIDSQIDREVYALYGLTDEEIKLVEATA
ncbi:MAG: Eco57I restriction-modification methylase domain-containing protein [Chthoniobacterales bacterium]